MPMYEYRCKRCETIFEEYQGINDKPLKKCPHCNGNVVRLISAPNVSAGPKTVGVLAENNANRMSDDEKKSVESTYLNEHADIEHRKKLKKIAKLDADGQKRYIETGKL